jgi:GNAT superfamily N-acetyltransferase
MTAPSTIDIGPLAAADREAAIELLVRQLREHAIATPRAAIAAVVDGALADERRALVLVAREGGTAVGIAYVSFTWTLEHGGRSCWLEELYVAPERRERGIGAALLDAVLARARATGCAAIDLEVEAEHARAARLYARRGFTPHTRARWVRRLD